eukprot:1148604-Pelagomonas_calceolata.AAC.3
MQAEKLSLHQGTGNTLFPKSRGFPPPQRKKKEETNGDQEGLEALGPARNVVTAHSFPAIPAWDLTLQKKI